jgi:hypothetical protein
MRVRQATWILLQHLQLAHAVPAGADGCSGVYAELHPAFSCRYYAATRLPSVMIPLDVLGCKTKPLDRCKAREGNWTQPSAPRPQLFVAITTIPPRAGAPLQRAVDSIYRQRRMPDALVVSAAARYRRFADASVDLSTLGAREGLQLISACDDHGPGTKLLCALPRLRQLAARHSGASGGASSRAFAVLLDDDLRYKPWALDYLEGVIREDANGERHAYSYDVYTLTPGGHAVVGGLYRGLLVGAGHALFAMRLSLLDGIEDFFDCVHALEPRSTYHDDVVISMFLQDVRGVPIFRIGGTPWEHATKTFPEVHENTVSFLSPGGTPPPPTLS